MHRGQATATKLGDLDKNRLQFPGGQTAVITKYVVFWCYSDISWYFAGMFSRFIKSLLSCPFLARCVRTCQDSGARSLRSFFPGPFTLTRGIRGHLDQLLSVVAAVASSWSWHNQSFPRCGAEIHIWTSSFWLYRSFLKHDRVYEWISMRSHIQTTSSWRSWRWSWQEWRWQWWCEFNAW